MTGKHLQTKVADAEVNTKPNFSTVGEDAFSIDPSSDVDGDEEDGEEGREDNKGEAGGESRLERSRHTKSSFPTSRNPGEVQFPKQGEEVRWKIHPSVSVVWVMSTD